MYRLYNYQRVHYQRIISNAILHSSHSLFSNANNLQGGWLTRILVIILQYSDACTELWLTFSNAYHVLF